MQGFTVKPGAAAGYWREFHISPDWAGLRIKLRFDAVYSDCRVWVNGHDVGTHQGGFTPFECDITGAVAAGVNTLALAVKNESIADTLASATQYAAHQLGGITRKVTMFVLPEVNIAGQFVTTTFDSLYRDATLHIEMSVANESGKGVPNGVLEFTLLDPQRKDTKAGPGLCALPELSPHGTVPSRISLEVPAPKTWDTEHPRLYTLKTVLKAGGLARETVLQKVGFRQVEIRGNRVFVNNRPLKLHGVNRHEVHPVRGRSLTPSLWRKDAELFRAANINYIRTSHYPPAEEFLTACDEMGIFVECEAPLCWVQHGANEIWHRWNYRDKAFYPLIARANLENVIANRNHPSIIIWSLANESYWSPLFAKTMELVRSADPSRLTSFHDQCWGGYNNGGSRAQVAVYHYPDEKGPALADSSDRPVLFGEYTHVETYNRREGVTDPGVRDNWGAPFERMYELVYRYAGCLGGAIWAGIDDIFLLPDGRVRGYGPWGIIDGWRRPKPEYWHVKKTYSPVRVIDRSEPLTPGADGRLSVRLENRYVFTNLGELSIRWSIGKESGKASADIPPGATGELRIFPRRPIQDGGTLKISCTDPRGFVCEEEEFAIGRMPHGELFTPISGRVVLDSTSERFTVKASTFTWEIDRSSGQIRRADVGGHTVLTGGPLLMILPLQTDECKPDYHADIAPLNAPCTKWRATGVTALLNGDSSASIAVEGEYEEASGSYTMIISARGEMKLSYKFTSAGEVNPRQWGMVFSLPRDVDRLRWQRQAQWTVYPSDHIGRPRGEARPNALSSTPGVEPHRPWSLDPSPLGDNDFRSTKSAILNASLRSAGGAGVRVVSRGRQAVRSWVDGEHIKWLVAGFNTGGGEGFFDMHYSAERRPIPKGSSIGDTVVLVLDRK
jgi:beta-galactosidase